MAVHQLLIGAASGDAVTSDALALRAALARHGRSEVYARHVEPQVRDVVHPIEELDTTSTSDVLVVHVSIGDPLVQAAIDAWAGELVVRYHNITPSTYFAHDPAFAELLDLGRASLPRLASRCRVALADSRFNAAELRDAGYGDVRVVPPACPWPRLLEAPDHEGMLNHLRVKVRGPLVLCVAQLLPHKRLDLVIAAHHLLATYHEPDAELVIVGAPRDPAHADALVRLQRELNLGRIWFTGAVSDPELATLYRHADVLLTLSDHEGFCMPLVEAMAFGVPIVARATTAIPETLGDAGILLPDAAGPVLAAEAMGLVVRDRAVRAALVERGRRRALRFHPDHAVAETVAVLDELVARR